MKEPQNLNEKKLVRGKERRKNFLSLLALVHRVPNCISLTRRHILYFLMVYVHYKHVLKFCQIFKILSCIFSETPCKEEYFYGNQEIVYFAKV